MKTFQVNEIFYSLQGEGIRAGTANVFIRFTGCNLRCSVEPGPLSPGGFDCDTEFMSGRKMDQGDIVREALKCSNGGTDVGIVFTGGEPGLQVTPELVQALKAYFNPVCIETNGTVNVDKLHLDWITVSPKVAEHAIEQIIASEVKYVRGYGQGIPKPVIQAGFYLISPAFDGGLVQHRTMEWCVALVRDNPKWRLSVQQHKLWNVR